MRFLIWTSYGALKWFKWAERQLWCFLYKYFIIFICLAHTFCLWQCSLIQTALYITHSWVFNAFSWLVPEKNKKREKHKAYKYGSFFYFLINVLIKSNKACTSCICYVSLWTIHFFFYILHARNLGCPTRVSGLWIGKLILAGQKKTGSVARGFKVNTLSSSALTSHVNKNCRDRGEMRKCPKSI